MQHRAAISGRDAAVWTFEAAWLPWTARVQLHQDTEILSKVELLDPLNADW